MKVLLDKNNYVTDYAILGDIVGSIEVEMPEGFEENFEAFKYENGKLVFDASYNEHLARVQQASAEIKTLKQLLSESDYKALKYAEGIISEEEYAPVKAQRQAWRDRINELENI